MPKLKRTLGLTECIFFGVGSILGAGIYTLIGKVAGHSGNLIWLSFIIASITALFTAFSYAELSAAFPRAGGEYEYVKNAFGKKMGVFLGMIISTNSMISGATVSLGFAGYLSGLIGIHLINAAFGILLVISIIALFSTANTILANMLSSSRVLLHMAQESKVFRHFSHISPTRKTSTKVLVLILILMLAFAAIGKIETVAMIANIFIFITFLIVNIAVVVLRLRNKTLRRLFTIPGNIKNIPVMSVLGIIMTVLLLIFNSYNLFI